MTEPLQELKNSLKQHGQSLTKARQTIFASLENKEPQTMREIVAACGDRVDRASVYRTIALFERIGVAQRLQIGWKYKLELSDAFHRHHHHLTCRRCGRTFPLPEDRQLEKRLEALADGRSFTMQGHQLEIQGLCEICSKT